VPHEGAQQHRLGALQLPSLVACEEYRLKIPEDAECQAALAYDEETRCIISYERSFTRPVF